MYTSTRNARYFWKNNAEHREIYSKDGTTYIKGVHLASFFLREWAREFIREKKREDGYRLSN